MKKEDALRIIFACAEEYKENLANRNLLFICANSAMKTTAIETVFGVGNFLHMTGVKFRKGREISANGFYRRCVDKRLTLNDFDMAKDGTTDLKLEVLPICVKANISANMAGNYNGLRPYLYTEKLVGGVRGGIGFVYDEKRGLYAPNTILNEDIRKITDEKIRIIATYRKSTKESEYSECVYMAKKLDWSKMRYPEAYHNLQPQLYEDKEKQDRNWSSGIRLAVSDLDGCLLDGEGRLPNDFSDALKAMEKRGVLFAAASGRSIIGSRMAFGTFSDSIAFITDNGARVFKDGRNIYNRILPYEEYSNVIKEMRRHEGLLAVACGTKGAWVEDKSVITPEMERELSKYYPEYHECSFDSIPDQIIKFALLYFDDIEKNIYPFFQKYDNDRICVQVTAFVWLDIYEKGISKGLGIEAIQRELGISPKETIVFGDYLNDLPMADFAVRSYAPENAHEKVKECFTETIRSNTESGVTNKIIELMN